MTATLGSNSGISEVPKPPYVVKPKSPHVVTFAQQPESARFRTMPRHAIETGCMDLVLHPKEIAGELARLSRRFRTVAASFPCGGSTAIASAKTVRR
jgi:hypothetical protein